MQKNSGGYEIEPSEQFTIAELQERLTQMPQDAIVYVRVGDVAQGRLKSVRFGLADGRVTLDAMPCS